MGGWKNSALLRHLPDSTKVTFIHGPCLSGAMKELIPTERIERFIFLIRGQKILLDADLALIYGVPTKVLNQGVKRNMRRFPSDFVFRLTAEQLEAVQSQIATGSQASRPSVSSLRVHRARRDHGAQSLKFLSYDVMMSKHHNVIAWRKENTCNGRGNTNHRLS